MLGINLLIFRLFYMESFLIETNYYRIEYGTESCGGEMPGVEAILVVCKRKVRSDYGAYYRFEYFSKWRE